MLTGAYKGGRRIGGSEFLPAGDSVGGRTGFGGHLPPVPVQRRTPHREGQSGVRPQRVPCAILRGWVRFGFTFTFLP